MPRFSLYVCPVGSLLIGMGASTALCEPPASRAVEVMQNLGLLDSRKPETIERSLSRFMDRFDSGAMSTDDLRVALGV
jgi:hypothetical protein